MAQNCSGALGALLRDLQTFNNEYRELYSAILISRPSKKEEDEKGIEYYSELLKLKIKPDDKEKLDVINAAISAARVRPGVAGQAASAKVVRDAARVEFVRAVSAASDTKLTIAFDENMAALHRDAELFESQYRELRLGQRVMPSAGTVGLPAVTVVDLPKSQTSGVSAETSSRRDAALTAAVEAKRRNALPSTVTSPRPSTLKESQIYEISSAIKKSVP